MLSVRAVVTWAVKVCPASSAAGNSWGALAAVCQEDGPHAFGIGLGHGGEGEGDGVLPEIPGSELSAVIGGQVILSL